MNEMNEQNEKNACACGGGSCCGGPGRWIWIALAVAVMGVLVARNAVRKPPAGPPANAKTPAAAEASAGAATVSDPAAQGQALPLLVDLGATKCIPCKMMAPILEELKKTHADKFKVEFIDVWQSPEPGKQYGVRVIPTQIFFSPDGKELFRHEGFYGKEDILGKWKELGF